VLTNLLCHCSLDSASADLTSWPIIVVGEPKLEAVRAMPESEAEEDEHNEEREENGLNPAFDIGRAGCVTPEPLPPFSVSDPLLVLMLLYVSLIP
jgi:hypothetical protein